MAAYNFTRIVIDTLMLYVMTFDFIIFTVAIYILNLINYPYFTFNDEKVRPLYCATTVVSH